MDVRSYLERMSRYPLEWGWHTAQTTEPSATEGTPRETLIGRKPQQGVDVQEAAVGDLLCVNHPRKNGMTATHSIGGQNLCRNCAVKKLGCEDLPSDEQSEAMKRWCLKPDD